MAPPSALIGKPSLTKDDTLVVRGYQLALGLPPNPARGLKLPAPAPPEPHDSRVPGFLAGVIIGMVIMVLATGTRLYIRATSRSLRFGWDDWTILLACTIALVYQAVILYMIAVGGAGRHMYDVTYWELGNYSTVSPHLQAPIKVEGTSLTPWIF